MKKIYRKVRKYFEIEKVCQHKFDIKDILNMECDPKCVYCGITLDSLTENDIKIKM